MPSSASVFVAWRLVPEQAVGERRLADTGGAEQRDRLGRPEVRRELVEPLAGDVADHVRRRAERDLLGLEQQRERVVAEVGLRQHERGRRTAFPGQGQVALDPGRAEVVVERGDDEDRVDVRGEHLRLGRGQVDLARERRATGQHGLDDVLAEGDPVADGGQVGARGRLVAQATGKVGAQLAGFGEHVVLAAVLCGDASRDAVVVWLERGREAVVPAEVLQVQTSSFQEWVETGHVPEASGSSLRKGVLRLAGSLRLCDRRVQSTSCRTSFAENSERSEPSSRGGAAGVLAAHGQCYRVER